MTDHKTCTAFLDVANILPILNKVSILAGLSPDQLYSVFRLLERVSYKEGEVVFERGEKPSHIYIIESGKVRLYAANGQATLEVVVFDEGQCFGEASVIGIRPHSVTAVAAEDTELIVLSRKALMSIYEQDTRIFSVLILNIAREACRRLHASSESLLYYISKK
ncbi:MAG: cyclic nucleotide-binding domain-containing protein [Phycisphaerae bacterium]|nr:cyclic nucleotide-binding domain-containing protein [Phycisphaerae bacterium]